MVGMTNPTTLIEPTGQQCTDHAVVGPGVACWYPQMGGYHAKAVVIPGGCAEVFVWHDGQFPFTDDNPRPDQPARSPARLHHSDGSQFVEFGRFLEQICDDD